MPAYIYLDSYAAELLLFIKFLSVCTAQALLPAIRNFVSLDSFRGVCITPYTSAKCELVTSFIYKRNFSISIK